MHFYWLHQHHLRICPVHRWRFYIKVLNVTQPVFVMKLWLKLRWKVE